MAEMMHIHVLGVVENMSYVLCPDCGKQIPVFGESHLEEFAEKMKFEILGKLPLDASNTKLVDQGKVEMINSDVINAIAKKITESK